VLTRAPLLDRVFASIAIAPLTRAPNAPLYAPNASPVSLGACVSYADGTTVRIGPTVISVCARAVRASRRSAIVAATSATARGVRRGATWTVEYIVTLRWVYPLRSRPLATVSD
jgi:hypothetical protein